VNTKKKILICIGSAITAIILGAIGSGLWERCFSRLYDGGINAIISIMSFLSSSYRNGIYIEAAKGFHEYSSLYLHTMVLSLVPLMYLMILWRHPYKKKAAPDSRMRVFIRSRRGYYLLSFLTFTVFVSFFFSLTRVTYVNSVVTTSRQSISILAPKISDMETKELWALFYSMKSSDDFNVFKGKLQKLANEKSVKLSSFDELWKRK